MPIALQLAGHEKDLGGGFIVRRLLPDARRRSVGPFIFFDHFGPAEELPGDLEMARLFGERVAAVAARFKG